MSASRVEAVPSSIPGLVVVRFSGPYGFSEQIASRPAVEAVLGGSPHGVILDCAAMKYLSDFVAGSDPENPAGFPKSDVPFLELQRRLLRQERFVALAAVPKRIAVVLEMLGFAKHVPSYATVADAERAFLERGSAGPAA